MLVSAVLRPVVVATSLISTHQDLKLYIHLNNVEVCCVITNLLKFNVISGKLYNMFTA